MTTNEVHLILVKLNCKVHETLMLFTFWFFLKKLFYEWYNLSTVAMSKRSLRKLQTMDSRDFSQLMSNPNTMIINKMSI